MIYIILITLILEIILISCLCISLYNETKVRKKIEKENEILENKISKCKLEIDFLRNIANNKLKNIRLKTNEEILNAVKYARKYSHPDNGGNPEDFHKFCDLYKKLIKQK